MPPLLQLTPNVCRDFRWIAYRDAGFFMTPNGLPRIYRKTVDLGRLLREALGSPLTFHPGPPARLVLRDNQLNWDAFKATLEDMDPMQDFAFLLPARSSSDTYTVTRRGERITCTCPGFENSKRTPRSCRHSLLLAVMLSDAAVRPGEFVAILNPPADTDSLAGVRIGDLYIDAGGIQLQVLTLSERTWVVKEDGFTTSVRNDDFSQFRKVASLVDPSDPMWSDGTLDAFVVGSRWRTVDQKTITITEPLTPGRTTCRGVVSGLLGNQVLQIVQLLGSTPEPALRPPADVDTTAVDTIVTDMPTRVWDAEGALVKLGRRYQLTDGRFVYLTVTGNPTAEPIRENTPLTVEHVTRSADGRSRTARLMLVGRDFQGAVFFKRGPWLAGILTQAAVPVEAPEPSDVFVTDALNDPLEPGSRYLLVDGRFIYLEEVRTLPTPLPSTLRLNVEVLTRNPDNSGFSSQVFTTLDAADLEDAIRYDQDTWPPSMPARAPEARSWPRRTRTKATRLSRPPEAASGVITRKIRFED